MCKKVKNFVKTNKKEIVKGVILAAVGVCAFAYMRQTRKSLYILWDEVDECLKRIYPGD